MRAGEATTTGRAYPAEVLHKMCGDNRDRVHRGGLVGELGMSESATIHLKDVSHVITSLEMDGDQLVAGVDVLNTPAGQQLDYLISIGVKVGLRLRCTGSGDIGEDGVLVMKNCRLIAVDAVMDYDETRSGYG